MTTKDAANFAELDTKFATLAQEFKSLEGAVKEMEVKANRPQIGGVTKANPLKDFLHSSQFSNWAKNKSGTSDKFEFKNIQQLFECKGVEGAGALRNVMSRELLQGIVADPLRKAHVRDLFPVYKTKDSVIEFARELVLNFNGAMVPEGTPKPESGVDYEEVTANVRTLATWIGVPRQLLSDIDQLADYLQNRLTNALQMVEDTQLLYGDGTSANLLGILNTPGIQTYSWSNGYGATSTYVGDTQIDAMRRGMTLAEVAYYPVTGGVCHPRTYEGIELLKSTEGLYVCVS